jgi:1-deoxy-D-xylulose-5-phosphate synthase
VPNITIAAPRDALELEYLVREWKKRSIPMAVRYPRSKAPLCVPRGLPDREAAPWGRLEVLCGGSGICLIGIGSTVELMLESADAIEEASGVRPTVADLRFIKPIDYEGLDRLLSSHSRIVTAEENALEGGVGEAVAARIKRLGLPAVLFAAGVPDRFISHASRSEQWEECGLTAENIKRLALS